MAPPNTGKKMIGIRLKADSIAAYKRLATDVGCDSHNLLIVSIVEDCLTYLLDGERTRMPDILLELKQKLPATQIHRAYAKLKAEPSAEEKLEQLLEQKIDTILSRRLAVSPKKTAARKKSVGRG